MGADYTPSAAADKASPVAGRESNRQELAPTAMPAILANNLSWIVLVVAIAGFWWWKRPDLTTERAHQLVEGGAALIDVRSPGEFAAGHIDGARNIPVGEVGGRAAEVGPLERPVVVYCASGTRSAMARRALRSAGFKEVYNLGPMSRW